MDSVLGEARHEPDAELIAKTALHFSTSLGLFPMVLCIITDSRMFHQLSLKLCIAHHLPVHNHNHIHIHVHIAACHARRTMVPQETNRAQKLDSSRLEHSFYRYICVPFQPETPSDPMGADGGGARGLSCLIILHEIMKRIQQAFGLAEIPDPMDFFDLIGGTGTGGWACVLLFWDSRLTKSCFVYPRIAVAMIGRLRMPTEIAINRYLKLAEVFSEKKRMGSGASVFKASKLEAVLKEIIEEATGNANEPMMESRADACRTYVTIASVEHLIKYLSFDSMVFAMSKYNMNAGIPCIIRSYQAQTDRIGDCTIWEALRATTAHPDLFKSVDIGDQYMRESFVDGSLGCSNPLVHILEEAKKLYPGQEVASILSIGAGHPRTIQIPKSSPFQRVLPVNAITAMKDIATDSERVAHEMAQRFSRTSDVYFRFSVDQGMQSVGIGEWERLPEVNAHTRAYMQQVQCDKTLNLAVNVIRTGKGVISTAQIGTGLGFIYPSQF
jgi:hypothetical protein